MNDLENPFVAHEKPGFKRVYDQLIFLYSIFYILIYIFFKTFSKVSCNFVGWGRFHRMLFKWLLSGENRGQQQISFIKNIIKKYSALNFMIILTNLRYQNNARKKILSGEILSDVQLRR